MRLFLALNLEPEVRRAVADATAPLRAEAPDLSWAAEVKLHMTLKFLGEQPEERVAEIRDAATRVASKHRGFAMRLGGVGAFPNFRRPRVVWMGVSADPRLELLHHDVEVACEALGFELDGRPFRPHLTLARVRDKIDAAVLKQLTRAAKKVDYEGECDVASLDLMHSVLGASSGYDKLHAAQLRAT